MVRAGIVPVTPRDGVAKPAQKSTFIGAISKRPGVRTGRPRHFQGHSHTVTTQSSVLWPPGAEQDMPMVDLSEALARFADAVVHWKRPAGGSAGWNQADDE